MTYNIKKYDKSTLVDIETGFVDDVSTSLSLIGKNVENFGALQNENYVYLLENFSGTTEPLNPIRGQIWYNTTQKQIFVYDGTTFSLLGPESAGNFATTRLISKVVLDSSGGQHPIIQVIVNGEVIAIISSVQFELGEPISGFTTIYRGITAKNYGSNNNDVRLFGKAMVAEVAETAVTTSITDDSTNIATTEFVHNILPKGIVLMWSGSIASIPSGWGLCNGSTYGTVVSPDLQNRFIRGASDTVAPGATGGADTVSATTNSAGIHSHDVTINGTSLSVEQLPAHNHSPANGNFFMTSNSVNRDSDTDFGGARDAISVSIGSNVTSTVGSGQTHAHSGSLQGDGTHTHTIPTINILPTWYALCYIIKIV
jgi:hypothetical protein